MCGRYSFTDPEAIPETFGVEGAPDLAKRFNVAPTQTIDTLKETAKWTTRQGA